MEKLIYLQLKNFSTKNQGLLMISYHNQRYIFSINKKNTENSIGSIGLRLLPFASTAIDKKYYPLGILNFR